MLPDSLGLEAWGSKAAFCYERMERLENSFGAEIEVKVGRKPGQTWCGSETVMCLLVCF